MGGCGRGWSDEWVWQGVGGCSGMYVAILVCHLFLCGVHAARACGVPTVIVHAYRMLCV